MSKLGFEAGGDHCCAVGCSHKRAKNQCSFFSFPTKKEWFDIWRLSVNRCAVDDNGRALPGKLWTPKSYHRLCSCHFTTPPNPKCRLIGWNHVKPDKLGSSTPAKGRTTKKSTNRKLPLKLKPENSAADLEKLESAPIDEPAADICTTSSIPEGAHSHVQVSRDHDYLCTVRDGQFVEEFDQLCKNFPQEMKDFLSDHQQATNAASLLEKMRLKGQVLSMESVKDRPTLFQYYTGLPSYDVFEALFEYLEDKTSDMQYVSTAGQAHNTDIFYSKPGPKRLMSMREEFFCTLVRLRLGLPSKHCARLFGVSESTFSVTFNTWVIVLSQELEKICSMPTTEKTLESRASCFDRFPGTRIVLDCTELFAQTPSTLENHKQVHSFYKHHCTVKFLVGMSPSGAINYVSDMWGGRASDKKITQESYDLLNSLDAGNSVMVDRGFTIAEDLPAGVKLLIPPFKNRITGQFTPEQIQFSEYLSVARIHIERAMRAIKESRLLEMEVKLAMINNYQNIFKACAYLVNFKQPFLKVSK